MKFYMYALICFYFCCATTFAQQSLCLSYFQKPTPAFLKYTSDQEHRYYVKNEFIKKSFQVRPINGPRLVSVETLLPIETTSSQLIEGGFLSNTPFAMILADENMNIYIDKKQIVNQRHHSTLVAGKPVLFAGMIKTDIHGVIVYLDFKSGHYKTSPYHLKWFIDLLGGVQNLKDVDVGFSDILDSRTTFSFLPIIKAPAFYKYTLNETDTGNHVLMRFLIHENPADYTSETSYNNILEPAVTQWIRFAYDHKLRATVFNDLDISESQALNIALRWIQEYLHQATPAQLLFLMDKSKQYHSQLGYRHAHHTWTLTFEKQIDMILNSYHN